MKLSNTTPFDSSFLRKMFVWCAGQVGVSTRKVREVSFRKARRSFGGRAYYGGRVSVRVEDKGYPIKYHRYDQDIEYLDVYEALVGVSAHELYHIYQFSERCRKHLEWGAVSASNKAVQAFRDNREELIAVWNVPDKKRTQAAQKVSVADRRESSVRSRLSEWQRKLKLAQTKVRKYKAKVQYYERRKAAMSGPSRDPVCGVREVPEELS